MSTAESRYRAEVRSQLRNALQEAFAIGPSAVTGEPMVPAEHLKRGGVPERFWSELREDFADATTETAVDSLARRWADRLVEHNGSDETRQRLINAMTGHS